MRIKIACILSIIFLACDKQYIDTTILNERIEIDKDSLRLDGEIRQTYQLNIKYFPDNSTDKTSTWLSLDTSVVKVDKIKGMAYAVGEGNASIIAISTDGKKDTVKVKVVGNPIAPDYCKIGNGGSNDETDYFITSLSTTGGSKNINYTTTTYPKGGYFFYQKDRLYISEGGRFQLSFTQHVAWSLSKVWIDWNRDGIFQDTEIAAEWGIINKDISPVDYTKTITAPKNIPKGVRVMRVFNINSYTTEEGKMIKNCGETSNASTVDFLITVN